MVTSIPLGGSFRDPAGYVYEVAGRILRTIRDPHINTHSYLRMSGFYDRFAQGGWMLEG